MEECALTDAAAVVRFPGCSGGGLVWDEGLAREIRNEHRIVGALAGTPQAQKRPTHKNRQNGTQWDSQSGLLNTARGGDDLGQEQGEAAVDREFKALQLELQEAAVSDRQYEDTSTGPLLGVDSGSVHVSALTGTAMPSSVHVPSLSRTGMPEREEREQAMCLEEEPSETSANAALSKHDPKGKASHGSSRAAGWDTDPDSASEEGDAAGNTRGLPLALSAVEAQLLEKLEGSGSISQWRPRGEVRSEEFTILLQPREEDVEVWTKYSRPADSLTAHATRMHWRHGSGSREESLREYVGVLQAQGSAGASLRSQVFEDLHRQGFTMTCGAKFGTEFLAYRGDPSEVHSLLMVKTVEEDDAMPALHLLTLARLALGARKHLVLASAPTEGSSQERSSIVPTEAGRITPTAQQRPVSGPRPMLGKETEQAEPREPLSQQTGSVELPPQQAEFPELTRQVAEPLEAPQTASFAHPHVPKYYTVTVDLDFIPREAKPEGHKMRAL